MHTDLFLSQSQRLEEKQIIQNTFVLLIMLIEPTTLPQTMKLTCIIQKSVLIILY